MRTWRKVGCCLLAASAACFAGVAWGETYTLTTNNGSNGPFSFEQAGGWSPTTSSAPCAGNNYVVLGTSESNVTTIRMSQNHTSPNIFGGDTLTLKYAQLNLFGLNNAEISVPDLVIDNFAQVCCQANGTWTLSGACLVPEGAVLKFLTIAGSAVMTTRKIIVTSAITGEGEVQSAYSGVYTLPGSSTTFEAGSLEGFTGKLSVLSDASWLQNHETIFNSFPADPEELMEDAITVDYGATLKFANTGELGANRGITFTANGKPVIEVADGCTVTIYGPMVAPNGFVKTGAGTLQLLGDVSQVNDDEVSTDAGSIIWGDRVIVAEVTGYYGAVDGATHSPNVEFSVPANGEGCTIQWQVVSDQDPTWSTTTPSFSEAGLHIVKYQITCEGRATQRGIVAMRLGDVGAVAFVSKVGSRQEPYDTPEKATDNLNTAVDYVYHLDLPEGSSRYVVMLPGFYSLSSTVTIGANLCVVGFGEDQTVISGAAASAVALEGSEIREITFDGAKNAIQARDGSTVNRCVVRNAASGSKYAIRAQGAVTVAATKVVGNTLDGDASGKGGNAPLVLASGGATLTVTDSQVCNNTVAALYCSAGVLSAEDTAYNGNIVVFDRCVFTNNSGRCGFCRIADSAETDSKLTMRNCLCVGCKSSTSSPSVFIYALAGEINNCTFDDCWADGELVYVGQKTPAGEDDHMVIHNCIFRNIRDKDGVLGEIGVSTMNRSGDKVVKADNSVVWPKVSAERLEEKSNTNYFEQDVTFVGPGQKLPEYALAQNSYGRKLGDPSVWADGALDLAGNPRVTFGKVDVGCYQWRSLDGFVLYLR